MYQQWWLDFVQQELLEALWDRFPEESRREVTDHYARLMARMLAGRVQSQRPEQEQSNEQRHP